MIKIVYFILGDFHHTHTHTHTQKEEAYRAEVWRGSKPGASRRPLLGWGGSWRVSPSPTPSV